MKRTLADEADEFRAAWIELWKGVYAVLEPPLRRALCTLGMHEFSAMHPHYCPACGKHYGLR